MHVHLPRQPESGQSPAPACTGPCRAQIIEATSATTSRHLCTGALASIPDVRRHQSFQDYHDGYGMGHGILIHSFYHVLITWYDLTWPSHPAGPIPPIVVPTLVCMSLDPAKSTRQKQISLTRYDYETWFALRACVSTECVCVCVSTECRGKEACVV